MGSSSTYSSLAARYPLFPEEGFFRPNGHRFHFFPTRLHPDPRFFLITSLSFSMASPDELSQYLLFLVSRFFFPPPTAVLPVSPSSHQQ